MTRREGEDVVVGPPDAPALIVRVTTISDGQVSLSFLGPLGIRRRVDVDRDLRDEASSNAAPRKIVARQGDEFICGDSPRSEGVLRLKSLDGDRVRIAFDFPPQVSLHRREVAEQILGRRILP